MLIIYVIDHPATQHTKTQCWSAGGVSRRRRTMDLRRFHWVVYDESPTNCNGGPGSGKVGHPGVADLVICEVQINEFIQRVTGVADNAVCR